MQLGPALAACDALESAGVERLAMLRGEDHQRADVDHAAGVLLYVDRYLASEPGQGRTRRKRGETTGARFVRLDVVAAELDASVENVLTLVRSGDLRAVRVGDRDPWRVEAVELEWFIGRAYRATRAFITETSSDSREAPELD